MTAAVIGVLSLTITLVVFETQSWYHIGDVPTKVVLFRLILSTAGIFCVLAAAAARINMRD